LYGRAAREWGALKKLLLPRIKEPDIRSRYYEAYFNAVRSAYIYGKNEKQPKYIAQAVNLIIVLESSPNGFGTDESKARFLELISQEKDLKDEYDRQKTGAKK
jgi:hypothetical protein